MPTELFEIRVTKITRLVTGAQIQETRYLVRPATAPDPGPLIASCNPTLVLPLPPPPRGTATSA